MGAGSPLTITLPKQTRSVFVEPAQGLPEFHTGGEGLDPCCVLVALGIGDCECDHSKVWAVFSWEERGILNGEGFSSGGNSGPTCLLGSQARMLMLSCP